MDTPQAAPAGDPLAPLTTHVGPAPRPIPILGELPLHTPQSRPHRHERKILLPVLLFVLTCITTFWVGSAATIAWEAVPRFFSIAPGGQLALHTREVLVLDGHWRNGLLYMVAVMGILLAHEMGHFLQALRYRIPASLPFFIPMPLPPMGTMGAVIGMQGSEADRRELFDIGLTGPLAGLVVALPLAWIGIKTAQPFPANAVATWQFNDPLLFRWLIGFLHPNLAPGQELAANPIYIAGWVGMLVTGLNMLPVSQLDGGHVAYALFGDRAHWLARGVMLAALVFVVLSRAYGWALMLMLVMYIGVDHPPTANDQAPLGWKRRVLGAASLAIPILCLSPNPISYVGP